jgi:hypothetical protein
MSAGVPARAEAYQELANGIAGCVIVDFDHCVQACRMRLGQTSKPCLCQFDCSTLAGNEFKGRIK